jgi:hypothetical protein
MSTNIFNYINMYMAHPSIVIADILLLLSIIMVCIGIYILQRRVKKLESAIDNLMKRG